MFGGHSVHVSSYEDVRWALRHPEVFSSKDVVDLGNDQPLIPLSVDPPEHAKYRRMLDPEFSPKKMTALEPEARALVNEIIDTFADKGDVRVPRRLRDAVAVDDLPRARRPAAERPPRLPALARRHDPPAGEHARGGRADPRGRQPLDQRLLHQRARGEAARTPTTGCSRASRTARSTAARSPTASSSACATCCCSAGSTP